MIGYIKGNLLEIFGNSCLVLTSGGVGYELALPAQTVASLPALGQEVEFFTFLSVREDALELYGFASFAERQAFEMLTSISRVGCRTALAILSLYAPEDLARIAMEEDIPSRGRVPGIGAKTAQHILLELKYKLKNSPIAKGSCTQRKAPSVMQDVLDGLANLGYAEEECAETVKNILSKDPDLDVGSALRATLKTLAARRN